MSFTEHAFVFPCAGETLLGIVAVPERSQATGVLLVVGGPQYRVGSHRQFLLLSRALADAGYPAMRFDYRGMGDSTGGLRDFEAVSDDIAAAIGAFQANCPELTRIVLWGLCDAASASLLYWDATRDARVGGLVLLNPWVRSEASLAKTHIKHYYGQRLLQAEFWRKLLTGNLGIGQALSGFRNNWMRARQTPDRAPFEDVLPFHKRMMRALKDFPGHVLLVLSGDDYTAKEFLEAIQADSPGAQVLESSRLTRIDVVGADHTFSDAKWRLAVQDATTAWMGNSW
jgi:exosortase A-associated hydrolase 1